MPITKLDRSVLCLTGKNVLPWLDGIITNSLDRGMIFAALLTPQVKIIADFFVTKGQNSLMIDTPTKFAADLLKRLKMYKLREKIEIEDLSDSHNVYAIWEGEGDEGHADPRLPALGRRLITEDGLDNTGDYDAHRLSLGTPDSQWDFETTSVFPADANMDLLNGIDFKKGCFVGQEVVSRMKRMTTVKKRMRGIILEDDAKTGDRVISGERVIGEILHTHGKIGMALIRLDRLKAATVSLTVNDNPVTVMGSPDGHTP